MFLMLIKIILLTLVVIAIAFPVQYFKCRFFDYQCAKCDGTFNPTVWGAVFSPQLLGIRYVKCLNCGKWNWAKLVLKENKTS